MENQITTCCSELVIKDVIKIPPIAVNNELKENVLNILKNKYENICCKYGYIFKVYNLSIDNEILIEMEDNSCDNLIKTEFTIYTCLPNINDKIIIKISKMDNALMVGINGPMMCIIKTQENLINSNYFYINNNKIYVKKTNKPIVEDDYIEIIIKKYKLQYNGNKSKIILIGYINNITTEEESIKYFISN